MVSIPLDKWYRYYLSRELSCSLFIFCLVYALCAFSFVLMSSKLYCHHSMLYRYLFLLLLSYGYHRFSGIATTHKVVLPPLSTGTTAIHQVVSRIKWFYYHPLCGTVAINHVVSLPLIKWYATINRVVPQPLIRC